MIVFAISVLVFVMSVFLLSDRLPAKVATHFNSAGRANGWMTKDGHVLFILIFGIGISAFITGICYLIRFFPASMLNVPNKDYWRSKEHYPEACDFMFRHSFWMASMVILLLTSVNYLIVQANRLNPPSMDAKGSFAVILLFFIGVLAWICFLIFHFYKKDGK
jgi:uncharacterized membrane protein